MDFNFEDFLDDLVSKTGHREQVDSLMDLIKLGVERAKESIVEVIIDEKGEYIPDKYSGVSLTSDVMDMNKVGNSYGNQETVVEEVFLDYNKDRYRWNNVSTGEKFCSLALTYHAERLQDVFEDISAEYNGEPEIYHFSSVFQQDKYEMLDPFDVFGRDTATPYGDNDLNASFKIIRNDVSKKLNGKNDCILSIGGEKTSASGRNMGNTVDCVYFNSKMFAAACKLRSERGVKGEDYIIDVTIEQDVVRLWNIMKNTIYDAVTFTYFYNDIVMQMLEKLHDLRPYLPIYGYMLIPDYTDKEVCVLDNPPSSKLTDYVVNSSKFNMYGLQVLSKPINGSIVFKCSHGLVSEDLFPQMDRWNYMPMSEAYDYYAMMTSVNIVRKENVRRAMKHYVLVSIGTVIENLLDFVFYFDYDNQRDVIKEHVVEPGVLFTHGSKCLDVSMFEGYKLKMILKDFNEVVRIDGCQKCKDDQVCYSCPVEIRTTGTCSKIQIIDINIDGLYLDRRLFLKKHGVVFDPGRKNCVLRSNSSYSEGFVDSDARFFSSIAHMNINALSYLRSPLPDTGDNDSELRDKEQNSFVAVERLVLGNGGVVKIEENLIPVENYISEEIFGSDNARRKGYADYISDYCKDGEVRTIPRIKIKGLGFSPLTNSWVYSEGAECDLFYDKYSMLSPSPRIVGVDFVENEDGTITLAENRLSSLKILNGTNVYGKGLFNNLDYFSVSSFKGTIDQFMCDSYVDGLVSDYVEV